MLSRLLGCVVAASILAGPAAAYSVKDGTVARPASIWTGLYIGGHVGGAWGDAEGRVDGYAERETLDLDGALGGLQAGYNWQSGNFVVGVEGDVSWGEFEGSRNYVVSDVLGFTAVDGRLTNELEYLASLRARVGYAAGNVLLYGTVGVAFTDYKLRLSFDDGVDTYAGSISDDATGWVVGGGIDWKVWDRVSLRGEVLHYMFDDIKFSDPDLGTLRIDADTTVVRGALNIHFNMP